MLGALCRECWSFGRVRNRERSASALNGRHRRNATTHTTRLHQSIRAPVPSNFTVLASHVGVSINVAKKNKRLLYEITQYYKLSASSLVGFSQPKLVSQQCFSLKKTSTNQPKPAPAPTSKQAQHCRSDFRATPATAQAKQKGKN